MTYMGASVGALVVDRNNWKTSSANWQTNANTAYDSGVWGSGTHWSSRWSTTNTDLTNMTNDRNYWKTTVAHDDPNVWTNRYNAGYAQATTDKQPPANPVVLSVAFSGSTPTSMTDQAVLTVDRTGYWKATATIGSLSLSVNTDVPLRFRYGGAFGVQGTFAFKGPAATNIGWGPDAPQLLTAGQQIAFQLNSSTPSAYSGGTLQATFVPTQAYPH